MRYLTKKGLPVTFGTLPAEKQIPEENTTSRSRGLYFTLTYCIATETKHFGMPPLQFCFYGFYQHLCSPEKLTCRFECVTEMTVSFNYHIFIHRFTVIGIQAVHTPVFNTYPHNRQRLQFPGNFFTMAACCN